MKHLQKKVNDWVSQYKDGYWDSFVILARLTEEVGELAREINHLEGPKKKKPQENSNGLEEELGDILFTVICMANKKGIDLDRAFDSSINKCYGRDRERFEKCY